MAHGSNVTFNHLERKKQSNGRPNHNSNGTIHNTTTSTTSPEADVQIYKGKLLPKQPAAASQEFGKSPGPTQSVPVRVLGGVSSHTIPPESAGKPPVQRIDHVMGGTHRPIHQIALSNSYIFPTCVFVGEIAIECGPIESVDYFHLTRAIARRHVSNCKSFSSIHIAPSAT